MMMWLVRRRPDRKVMFASTTGPDALHWAARHMGYPDAILDADLLPECIFWFEIAEVHAGHPGEDAVAYVGYTDWEIGANEDPGAFHVVVTTDNSPSVRVLDALIPLTHERNHT